MMSALPPKADIPQRNLDALIAKLVAMYHGIVIGFPTILATIAPT
jgi:hypothetical protein